MRYTRKMVMIPEDEYQILLRLMSRGGGDSLQSEKNVLDAQIISTLADPRLEPDIKQKKYSSLYKQRRQLKGIIENRPQKVVIENISQTPPNIPPYLGITNEDGRKLVKVEKQDDYDTDVDDSDFKTPQYFEEETPKTSKKPFLLNSIQYTKLLKYVTNNYDKVGVELDGRIRTFNNQAIKNSNFRKVLDYMAGKTETVPRGYKFFLSALKRDNYASQILANEPQKGLGRRKVLVKMKNIIKTPGIKRSKPIKFKPQLWAKL